MDIKIGSKYHIDIDNEEYGRIASDVRVMENVGNNEYLVEVFTIRANIICTDKELK